ncbi:beta-ketoacyl-[acyl-carrier-protein] synthase family protein [Phytohabitans sp. ZYX-F-186]|uniref:Beta-ketoacyl-[acyl-carrier-protein] synthase family protein n=1 Tax=Phytohabitans maris TaxID=3071409 RepID=A0ABU0ZLY7_9ACTN|nr:beta-ketoacyl-[acyl-carrier-protein] synthase family protein [Phytohabitans sp. ZYX-F-186]MDQ7907412.1 beta-ketoacyl-[acyl-carrier-protein] synthase family protein [Phytohabitans sp. ZYX-F-186]
MTPRQAVITGIGVVAPGGIGGKQFWQLLTDGRTATRRITLFDPSSFRSQIAAECDFDPAAFGLTAQEARRMDRCTQFAVVAAREAIADAAFEPETTAPQRLAVSVGTATGCTISLEREYIVVSDGGRDWDVDPAYAAPHLYQWLAPSSIATELAWLIQAEGPAGVVSTGCTSGLDAVTHAAGLIEDGLADVVLAGAADAPISPITSACFDAIKATSPNNANPERASRPFDRDRDGFVLGEGGAMFIVEDREHARRRGAAPYCAIAGHASRSNAYHMTGLKPDGLDMAEAIRSALDAARLNPDDIDYVNAHGSSTVQNDRHETGAFKASLGAHAYAVPVSSIKSMVGHSLGGIGAIELAACALAIRHNVVPPTANLETPDPVCDLDYVPNVARELPVDVVLSVGSGFGGFQTAVLLAGPGASG